MNFLAVLTLVFLSHGSPARCLDLFSKGPSLSQIPRVGFREVPYETSEILRHGRVLNLADPKQLSDYRENMLLSRDGVYVFLLDRQGTMTIDHQLPLPVDYSKAAFHGTHRGLLRLREQDFAHLGKPEIIFAGEFMVTAGKVVWLSDQSIFFFDTPKVPQRAGETARDFRLRNQRDRENLRQLAKSRFMAVRNLLLGWSWIDHETGIRHIDDAADADGGTRLWAHRVSRQLALFERNCRAQQACMDVFERLQNQVLRLAEVNGLRLDSERIQQLLRLDSGRSALLVQSLTKIRDAGVVGLMQEQVNVQTGELSKYLQDVFESIDWYVQTLPNLP
jgi:hypothetical protein